MEKKDYNKLYYQKNKEKIINRSKECYKVKKATHNVEDVEEKIKRRANEKQATNILFEFIKHSNEKNEKEDVVVMRFKLSIIIKNIMNDNFNKIYRMINKDKEIKEIIKNLEINEEGEGEKIIMDLIEKLNQNN